MGILMKRTGIKTPPEDSVERVSGHEYYIGVAKSISRASTCLRRKYGAVLVKNGAIISTGYNGSPRGEENCCDTFKCLREEMKVPQGSNYELCRGIHAEKNALLNTGGRCSAQGATLYLYGKDSTTGKTILALPCNLCELDLIQCGVKEVYHSVENNGD